MPTWMVRGERGRFYDIFRERSIVAIGWPEIAADVRPEMTRAEIATLYQMRVPRLSWPSAYTGASQIWRFINQIAIGDTVVTYSPGNRTYLLGEVRSTATYTADTADQGLAIVRSVNWREIEIARDRLSVRSKNSLGSTLTIFRLPDDVAEELARLIEAPDMVIEERPRNDVSDFEPLDDPNQVTSLDGIQAQALERVKDLVVNLSWDEMQELVAGILRAMGYKTQISPPGPDRGRDIVASPDGFGFEHPRIVVEVKHRSGQVNSQTIRSFIGGRHADDRGLYVSTGGFTREAKYEADRSPIPLALWDADLLVRTLIDHYDTTDSETKRLIPLKRIYVPA